MGNIKLKYMGVSTFNNGVVYDAAFTCNLSLVNGTAFITNPKFDLTSLVGKKLTFTAGGKTLVGWGKAVGSAETLDTEITTGTCVTGKLYKITATETNHYGSGLVVGSYFTSAGTETNDANNKVRQVLTPNGGHKAGLTIVSAQGGSTYSWTSNDGIDGNSAIFTLWATNS